MNTFVLPPGVYRIEFVLLDVRTRCPFGGTTDRSRIEIAIIPRRIGIEAGSLLGWIDEHVTGEAISTEALAVVLADAIVESTDAKNVTVRITQSPLVGIELIVSASRPDY